MSTIRSTAFRTLIAVLGAVNVFLGLNVGLGGLRTLGWQGAGVFYAVTDEHLYLIRDSHTRFYGGLYVAVGLFLLLAATNPGRFRVGLHLVFAMIFVGGLARLTVLRPDVLLGADLVTSIGIELIVMPLLGLWLALMTRPPAPRLARPAQRFAEVCE